jgi:hypothetical protein
LLVQQVKGDGRQAFAGEFAGNQAGHDAMGVAKAGGAHVGPS